MPSSLPKQTKTTILHILEKMDSTLEARAILDLASMTQRAGGRAVIASSGGELVIDAERIGVRHITFNSFRSNFWNLWQGKRDLDFIINGVKPDVIHVHEISKFIHLIPSHHRSRILLEANKTVAGSSSQRAILAHVLKLGGQILVPNETMRLWFLENWGCNNNSDQVHVLPYGIDGTLYAPDRMTPERARILASKWRIPEHSHVALMAMPLSPDNGQFKILEAMKQLQDASLFVVLLGDDTEAPGTRLQLETMISSLGLCGKVVMPDTCGDWPAAMWLASFVLAINSKPRGSYLDLIFAQAMGRPVIVTDCGSNKESVNIGTTAWIVPVGDTVALVNAMREAISILPAQRMALADNIHSFIENRFPRRSWLQGIFDLYSELQSLPTRTK